MKSVKPKTVVTKIAVDQIAVTNPRIRNRKIFRQIVESIAKVGLKKPITVTRYESTESARPYQLVCGQGRLEAFIELGESEIPAFVVDASEEDSMVMSLVENLARRHHRPLELLQDIGDLGKRGYSDREIAEKTGLSNKYVRSIRHRIDEGEERLLTAVECGHIPVKVAIDIADTDVDGAQEALAQAYQNGLLRGKKLLIAKHLVERRQRAGKSVHRRGSAERRSGLSSAALVRAYEREAERQRLMIKKADIAQNRLLFIVEAMRQLLRDDNFVTLLRAENLVTMPRPLADLVSGQKD